MAEKKINIGKRVLNVAFGTFSHNDGQCRLPITFARDELEAAKVDLLLIDTVITATISYDPECGGDVDGQSKLVETSEEIDIVCSSARCGATGKKFSGSLSFSIKPEMFSKVARFAGHDGKIRIKKIVAIETSVEPTEDVEDLKTTLAIK